CLGPCAPAREDFVHDASLGRPTNLRPLHQPSREAAFFLSALSGKPDPRSLRLPRHPYLDQEPSQKFVADSRRIKKLIQQSCAYLKQPCMMDEIARWCAILRL